MRPLLCFKDFVNQKMNEEFDGLDNFDDLEDFRTFKGSVDQFKAYWDKKAGREIDPFKGKDYLYPKPHKRVD